jgi:hypothetical protein
MTSDEMPCHGSFVRGATLIFSMMPLLRFMTYVRSAARTARLVSTVLTPPVFISFIHEL